jgi:hypothetical protein
VRGSRAAAVCGRLNFTELEFFDCVAVCLPFEVSPFGNCHAALALDELVEPADCHWAAELAAEALTTAMVTSSRQTTFAAGRAKRYVANIGRSFGGR